MKFKIFTKREICVKYVIYAIIAIVSAIFICSFFYMKSHPKLDMSAEAFLLSIIYALFLFIITLWLNKIDNNTRAKFNERVGYYYTLKRLEKVMASTTEIANMEDLEDVNSKIIAFVVSTGRSDNQKKELAEGKRVKPFIRENGFKFSEEMEALEKKYFSSKDKQSKAIISKELMRLYKGSYKKLIKEIERIENTYKGTLQTVLEYDNITANMEFFLDEINSKLDSISSGFPDGISELQSDLNDSQAELKTINEKLDNIYEIIDSIESITNK